MPTVFFTSQLARFIDAPTVVAPGDTLDAVLGNVFSDHPQLKGYILDDQGAIRRHVAVFIDGMQVRDRTNLSVALNDKSEIHIFQALSGG
ncbi:MAG: MoaD/ThiS family protein [Rhodospirillales bacterium]|nr:MoaD/ThiS family protein [Rhodospirillales bacterium]